MNKSIKQRWLEALRSGKYEQGRYYLRNDRDEYCCLGVLCDLHTEVTGEDWLLTSDGFHDSYDYLFNNQLLPQEVVDWAGFEDEDPQVQTSPGDEYESLAYLNDNGCGFDEITDIIEKCL